MKVLLVVLLSFGVVALLAGLFGKRLLMWMIMAKTNQYIKQEYSVQEQADWFGQTGLSEEDERELAHYLRREFGERIKDPGALKASDLKYLGVFRDQDGIAHFWAIPSRHPKQSQAYAYVDCDEQGGGLSYGWGGREPKGEAMPRST